MWIIVLFLFMSALACTSGAETQKAAVLSLMPANKKTIQWVVHDFPPLLKLPSDDLIVDITKAQGPAVELYAILRKSLPQYEQRYIRIPFSRIENLFNERKQLCTISLQRNPSRESFLNFGEEVAVSLPVGLITREDLPIKRMVNREGVIDIEKTLQKKKFRLGLVQGRFYSSQLAPVLGRQSLLYSLVSDGSAQNLFRMLSSGRLDGVLGYYLEMVEFEKKLDKAAFQFHKILEAPEYLVLQAACERSPWGDQVLRDVSKVIKDKRFKEISHRYFTSVLPPGRRQDYERLYQERPAN